MQGADVEIGVRLYEQLGLRANLMQEVVDFIDRCVRERETDS